MTHLRVVDDTFSGNARHSIRATDLSPEQIADLEWAARHVLGPAQAAIRELQEAVERRRPDLLVACERRLLACGLVAGDHARTLEKETR